MVHPVFALYAALFRSQVFYKYTSDTYFLLIIAVTFRIGKYDKRGL